MSYLGSHLTTYFRPRSVDPDVSFRERTIRVVVLLMLAISVLALAALLVMDAPPFRTFRGSRLFAFEAVIAVMVALLAISFVTVERGSILWAGLFLAGGVIVALCGIIAIAGYWAPLTFPAL